ncbi:hypothetical protein [Bradyrhizobium sp. USDA 4353]
MDTRTTGKDMADFLIMAGASDCKPSGWWPRRQMAAIMKISLSLFQKMCSTASILLRHEGRIAIVTTCEAGRRWPLACRSAYPCADERQLADAKSCGPGAATLAPSCRAMIPTATVAKEPYTEEITI